MSVLIDERTKVIVQGITGRDDQTEAVVLIEEIGGAEEEKAAKFIRARMRKKIVAFISARTALPGKRMGHRVYKAKDPRATIAEQMLLELSEQKNDFRLYEFLKQLEKSFRARMEEKGKPIYPNVDFFSEAVYTMLGIARYLFTPIFAVARSPGWLARILEQRKDNRLYRPRSLFVGPGPRRMCRWKKGPRPRFPRRETRGV